MVKKGVGKLKNFNKRGIQIEYTLLTEIIDFVVVGEKKVTVNYTYTQNL